MTDVNIRAKRTLSARNKPYAHEIRYGDPGILTYVWVYASILSFLVPKFEIGGTYVGLLDILSLGAVVVFPFRRTRLHFSSQHKVDLAYVGVLLLMSLFWGIAEGDMKSVLIGVRTFTIALAAIFAAAALNVRYIKTIVANCTIIIAAIYIYPAAKTAFALLTGALDTTQFLWDYDAGRLKAPFETSSTTSVPIGYLFSVGFVACLFLMRMSAATKRRWFWQGMSLAYFLFAFLTASRTATLCCVLSGLFYYAAELFRSPSKGQIIKVAVLAMLSVYTIKIGIEKTFSNGALDSSTGQRLIYYQSGLHLTSEGISRLLIGYGVSDNLLEQKTGTAFYESMLVNSQMQGGVLLLAAALVVVVTPLFRYLREYRKAAKTGLGLGLAATVLIGNAVGGSNYFSIFVYMYYCLATALLFNAWHKNRCFQSSLPHNLKTYCRR